MTTGYFSGTFRDGGAVPARPTTGLAGDQIPVLDYIFTTGAFPWTKTVDGTNLVSYQAPGGSQIKVQFNDNIANTLTHYMLVRATVSGQVFPSSAQETSIGHVYLRKAGASAGIWTYGFFWTRTDRMISIYGIYTNGVHNQAGGGLVAGDLPVFDSSDPGLCVVLGTLTTSLPATLTSNIGSLFLINTAPLLAGYSYNNKSNTLVSCPAYIHSPAVTTSTSSSAVSSYAGGVPLFRLIIGTSTNQSIASATVIQRGYVPYWYAPAAFSGYSLHNQNTLTGDTFTAGPANFECVTQNNPGAGAWPTVYMTNDQENLP